MAYVIKQEGLYQNKVNSSLVSICNCKMDYYWTRLRKYRDQFVSVSQIYYSAEANNWSARHTDKSR